MKKNGPIVDHDVDLAEFAKRWLHDFLAELLAAHTAIDQQTFPTMLFHMPWRFPRVLYLLRAK